MKSCKNLLALSIATIISASATADIKYLNESDLNADSKIYKPDSQSGFYIASNTRYQSSASESSIEWDNHDETVFQTALTLGYESDYFKDFIGFEIRHHGVFSIDNSISGFSQNEGNLKAKLNENAELRFGDLILDLPLMKNKVDMVTPALTRSLAVNTNFNDTNIYYLRAFENIGSYEAGFDSHDAEIFAGDTDVHILGLSSDIQNWEYHLSAGTQYDFKTKFYGEIQSPDYKIMSTDISFMVNGGYTSSEGILKEYYSQNNETESAGWYSAKIDFTKGNTNVFLTGQNISDSDGMEADASWFGGSYLDFMGYNNSQISDFSSPDMRSWSAGVSHEILDGLKAEAVYIKGNSAYSNEKEYNLSLSYKHPEYPILASIQHGKNTFEEGDDITQIKDTIASIRFLHTF
ncbi:hypothetical protein [Endozoicomonas acroporae]|uniref:hypothetical protein n=1 Tax=Endozoicomonas acroporae TaxID=1701104 RepID=UPI003D792D79